MLFKPLQRVSRVCTAEGPGGGSELDLKPLLERESPSQYENTKLFARSKYLRQRRDLKVCPGCAEAALKGKCSGKSEGLREGEVLCAYNTRREKEAEGMWDPVQKK